MANEAVLKVEYSPPVNFDVDNTVGIEKGTICKLTSSMTASASAAAADFVAGIAATEKIASDGRTKLGMYRDGIFLVYVSGTASAGEAMTTDAADGYVTHILAGVSGCKVLGYMMEDATTGQQKLMELNIAGGTSTA